MKTQKRLKNVAVLVRERTRVIKTLPRWRTVIRGTLRRSFLACGRPVCRCHKAKKYRHGPYWYLAVTYAKGRQKMYLIPASKQRRVAAGIRAYKALWKKLCRISELNVELAKRG